MKTIELENNYLDQDDHDYLAELCYQFLADKAMFPQSIGYKIIIDYIPQEDDKQ